MNTRSAPRALLLMALVLSAGGASAAVVTLKDGSVLRGKVAGQKGDALELVTPDGTLRVSQERVLRVDYAEEPAPLPGVVTRTEAAPAPGTRGKHSVSLDLGLIQPLSGISFGSIGGGDAQNGDLGLKVGAQYLYSLTESLGAGAEISYLNRSGSISPRLFPNATSSVSGDSWLMLGVLRWSLPRLGRTRPFVLVGGGGARNTMSVDVRPAAWADTNTDETRRLVDDARWTPAGAARLGLDIEADSLSPGVLTVEAGWVGMAATTYDSTPQGKARGLSGVSAPLNLLAFSVRYGWRF